MPYLHGKRGQGLLCLKGRISPLLTTFSHWLKNILFVGVPSPVIQFFRKIEKEPGPYYFACAVNAGQVSRTLIQLRQLSVN